MVVLVDLVLLGEPNGSIEPIWVRKGKDVALLVLLLGHRIELSVMRLDLSVISNIVILRKYSGLVRV